MNDNNQSTESMSSESLYDNAVPVEDTDQEIDDDLFNPISVDRVQQT